MFLAAIIGSYFLINTPYLNTSANLNAMLTQLLFYRKRLELTEEER